MNDSLKIGEEIFTNIPNEKQPHWGSLILAEFKNVLNQEPLEILELREIINSNNWHKAHNQFSKIRNLILTNSDKQKEIYYLLAESISKITFNQTVTNAPFDLDSGYWIYQLAMKLVELSNSKIKKDRIEGLLNLFELNKHQNNIFAKETLVSFENLKVKIFNSPNEEYVQLKREIGVNCSIEELKAKSPKSMLYKNHRTHPDGSFEFQYDLNIKDDKIGYYSLIWDNELKLIDEYYVTK